MGYDRDELITIGERFNTNSLLEWSIQIAQAAKKDLPRLKNRGITSQTLGEIEEARNQVQTLNLGQEREKKDLTAGAYSRREAIQAALDWREEVKALATAVFDSEPDVLARFRTGVRVSQSLPKLTTELGLLNGALREHLDALRGVGADEELVKRGDEARGRLEETQRFLAQDRSETPEATSELYHAQGILYTRGRFVSRIAAAEFRRDDALLGKYSYAPLRRQEAAAESRRVRRAVTAR